MKRLGFIFLILFVLLVGCTTNNEKTSTLNTNANPTTNPSTITNSTTTTTKIDDDKKRELIYKELSSYCDNLLEKTDSYIPYWNKESFKGKWNYIDGVFLNSLVNLYKNTSDSKYSDFLINYINYYIEPSGSFLNLKDSEAVGFTEGELDTICASKILFDAYELTKDNRYINAINYTYNRLLEIPRAGDTINFSHKVSYLNQIWLDGMYMYVPFYARYANFYNKMEILDEIINQYKIIRNNMFNSNTGLYYHGYDTTKTIFWANEIGCSENHWLRSMGWYIVSICDVLEYYPDGENKEYLINLLKEAITGVLKYQDKDSKMFYQIVDKMKISVNVPYEYFKALNNKKYTNSAVVQNYLESSGSSMIAYAILKASRLGYLPSGYLSIGSEIFEGIYNHSFKNGMLNDICITAGLGPSSKPYRDGSVEYYLAEPVGSDDAKGVGPFIMAYIEYRYGE